MEVNEFDSTLGGTENLPFAANSLKFAASRSIEIAAMTESILRPSKTKLIFQTLPVHMRRRVMSHNCKRLPRKLREGHLKQLQKSGLPPQQKRPSRKYRRRPANLLQEYNRRQRQKIWLETHIWHAKRFHMIERWGHKLAYAPCDKAFRACYRATSAHCLIQDVSYYVPIKITGTENSMRELFKNITDQRCGLSVVAKAFTTGKREGTIHIYNNNSYPFGYVGKINFLWTQNECENSLWLFVHPSQAKKVESLLIDMVEQNNKTEEYKSIEKKRKIENNTEKITIKALPGAYNRFKLTGPNSHAVLVRCLKPIHDVDQIKDNEWVSSFYKLNTPDLYFKEKYLYWQNFILANSPAQLPPRLIIGLTVKDPRFSRPSIRTKAKQDKDGFINTDSLINTKPNIAFSPLWCTDINNIIKKNKLTNGEFIKHITKTQLVPGEINEDDPLFQSIPVVLIQTPGIQDSNYKKLGYGSGWDIIVPSGYGMQFWQTFIMFGARSGGLRETESLAFEMGKCYLPPDSDAGADEEKRIELEMREKYFRLPPSKRVNYIKLSVVSPFICPWKMLASDWSNSKVEDIFVLRDKTILQNIQDCVSKKKVPVLEKMQSCLIAIYLKIIGKGAMKKHALICLPDHKDVNNTNGLYEPQKEDPNENIRKQKRIEHQKEIKSLRRKKINLKKKKSETLQSTNKKKKQKPHAASSYVKEMRELWLPSKVDNIRHSCFRQVMGYITNGAFSFSESKSCGIGYITYNALEILLRNKMNQVLVRNTTSRKYRLANLEIIIH